MPLLERPLRLKSRYLAEPSIKVCAERSHYLTESFKQTEGEPIVIRRAKAFQSILQNITIKIDEEELIVGRQTKYVKGCFAYPEFAVKWMKADVDKLRQRDFQKVIIDEAEMGILATDLEYWEGKCLQDQSEALWLEFLGPAVFEAKEARVFHDVTPRTWGRLSVDYSKVLNQGLQQIIVEAEGKIADWRAKGSFTAPTMEQLFFWQAVQISCQAVIDLAGRYARLAEELAAQESNPQRQSELLQIAEVCRWVPANPARTFHEALQSFWFIHLVVQIENCSAGYSPGRFDQYLYPFYKQHVQNMGTSALETAQELLGCLWVKFVEIERFNSLDYSEVAPSLFQNITVGGQTREGKDATNELSYLILEVTEAMKLPQPTISLRYFDGISQDFLLRAARVVRDWGGGIPAWFNDKAALSILPYYGVSMEDARNYCPIGCVEMGVPAATPLMTGPGFLSLAKCLEITLHDGFDPRLQKQIGLHTGNPCSFSTYGDLWEAFRQQVTHFLRIMVHSAHMSIGLHPTTTPTPLISSLMNDCIAKGKDITAGGARYNRFYCWTPREVIDAGNSLTAIKKLVYDDKTLSMETLLAALAADFVNAGTVQRQLLDAPKYGNDNDYADATVDALFNLCKELTDQHTNQFGEPLSVNFLGITTHYFFGKAIGALPSGRKAYQPCTDGSLSAERGTDLTGPTALIKSASKVDYRPALCTLLNMKFHPRSLIGMEGLKNMLSLIKSYFDLDGWHVQFNVIGKETLIKAKENPQEHRDLVIRVAGFSMFWVDLAPHIQDEIIARTEHAF